MEDQFLQQTHLEVPQNFDGLPFELREQAFKFCDLSCFKSLSKVMVSLGISSHVYGPREREAFMSVKLE